ncbi:MFS transporter [Plantactinospora sp. GCM10030261]|uniref:MFS transporter n=1 Tax=Plantactinospora sp. GCM10030261 TaxID=3273420 RepID=UPI0036194D07
MSLRTALVDVRPLARAPAFRRLWLGGVVSGFGGQLTSFAITFHVWDRTRDPAMVGLIGLFTAAPLIAFALIGGTAADRVDRRRLVLASTWGQVGTSLGLAGVAAFAGDAVWAMLAIAAVASALSALGAPARRALVPTLLPGDQLAAGLALTHLSFQASLLLGPAAAGALVALWGTAVCFVIDAGTFVLALIALAGLPTLAAGTRPAGSQPGGTGAGGEPGGTGPAGSQPGGTPSPGGRAVGAGIRFAAGNPVVRGAFLTDLCATVLAMPVALFPVLNAEKFGGSPAVLGLFTTALAVGGVLASAVSGFTTRQPRPGRLLLACVTVWGAALAGVGLADQLPVVLGLIAVAGAADTWSVVARGTVVQHVTPEAYRGRVSALEHVVGVAGPQLGGLRAGLVAAGTGGGVALLLGGFGCLAGVGLIAARIPQLRRLTIGPAPPA